MFITNQNGWSRISHLKWLRKTRHVLKDPWNDHPSANFEHPSWYQQKRAWPKWFQKDVRDWGSLSICCCNLPHLLRTSDHCSSLGTATFKYDGKYKHLHSTKSWCVHPSPPNVYSQGFVPSQNLTKNTSQNRWDDNRRLDFGCQVHFPESTHPWSLTANARKTIRLSFRAIWTHFQGLS